MWSTAAPAAAPAHRKPEQGRPRPAAFTGVDRWRVASLSRPEGCGGPAEAARLPFPRRCEVRRRCPRNDGRAEWLPAPLAASRRRRARSLPSRLSHLGIRVSRDGLECVVQSPHPRRTPWGAPSPPPQASPLCYHGLPVLCCGPDTCFFHLSHCGSKAFQVLRGP